METCLQIYQNYKNVINRNKLGKNKSLLLKDTYKFQQLPIKDITITKQLTKLDRRINIHISLFNCTECPSPIFSEIFHIRINLNNASRFGKTKITRRKKRLTSQNLTKNTPSFSFSLWRFHMA